LVSVVYCGTYIIFVLLYLMYLWHAYPVLNAIRRICMLQKTMQTGLEAAEVIWKIRGLIFGLCVLYTAAHTYIYVSLIISYMPLVIPLI